MGENKRMKHTFGPVPSRRLGFSLGVDLVPFKTCTVDCIYCQLGKATCKTVERKEYAAPSEIIAEFERKEQKAYLEVCGKSGKGKENNLTNPSG